MSRGSARTGAGYGVAALTVGSGAAPFPLPPPPHDFTEAALAEVVHEAAPLEVVDSQGVSHPVSEWLHLPLGTRVIGPVYDPARDHDFRVDAGQLLDCVDVLVHVPRGAATSLLAVKRNS